MTGPRIDIPAQYPIHILLAEDDSNDQTLFCAAARKTYLNLQVQIVSHGHSALEYLQGTGLYADRATHPLPDVMAVDLRMPLMDGFEFLAWRRGSTLFRALPVVAMSGSVDESWAERALAAGASRFYVKPNRFAEWMKMVREIADLGQLHAAHAHPEEEPALVGNAH